MLDKMKVIVLGGAGVMGSYAVDVLSRGKIFSEIKVADINEEKGKEMEEKMDGVEFVRLDATSREELSQVMKDADVVVNCIGPFYKFAPGIVEIAITTGVDYVDICDDYDVTQKLLDEMDEKAKNEGVTCIVGLGASPGITNVIAAYAASMLSSVREITVYVTRGIKEEAGGAIPYHMLHCWLGEIPVYIRGEHRKAKGLVDGKEWVKFPEPFGEASVYYFGHPETVTLPRYIEGVKNVSCKGTFFPQEFREMLLQLESTGLLSPEPINIKGIDISPLDFLASFIASTVKKMGNIPNIPEGGAVMVRVNGEKNGEEREYVFSGISRMREATATPVAVGAEMVANGEIRMHGVNAPEGCVPPRKFLNRLIKENIFHGIWMTTKERLKEL